MNNKLKHIFWLVIAYSFVMLLSRVFMEGESAWNLFAQVCYYGSAIAAFHICAIWGVLGPGPLFRRLSVATLTLAILSCAWLYTDTLGIGSLSKAPSDSEIQSLVEIHCCIWAIPICWIVAIGMQLISRYLLFYKLVFQDDSQTTSRSQLTISDFIVWTTLVAFLLFLVDYNSFLAYAVDSGSYNKHANPFVLPVLIPFVICSYLFLVLPAQVLIWGKWFEEFEWKKAVGIYVSLAVVLVTCLIGFGGGQEAIKEDSSFQILSAGVALAFFVALPMGLARKNGFVFQQYRLKGFSQNSTRLNQTGREMAV